MVWERITEDLLYAHAQWQRHESHSTATAGYPARSLSREQAEHLIDRARRLLATDPVPSPGDEDSALIVTKAPHTGSDETVIEILARCLAFGVTVKRVTRKKSADADNIAHALYPDVWLNYIRMPTGASTWSIIDRMFDNSDYTFIFGTHYRRTAVITGHQACSDNDLTHDDLMSIWQTGREPLTRSTAIASYGARAASVLFPPGGGDTYQWYRGPFPIGIQKITSNLMAFALRHERLYDGRPVIVLNGHFTLLSQRFRGAGDRGATVVELALGDRLEIQDVRTQLIGGSDQPEECLTGSIRRDAYDGFFYTDAPGDRVVPWANAVHASDGYLAGALEAAAILGQAEAGAMRRRLADLGYASAEIDKLIMKDPVVSSHGEEQRLTKRTAMLSMDQCTAVIKRWFPPLGTAPSPPASAYLLSELVESAGAGQLRVTLNQPHPEPGSRRPTPTSTRDCVDLPESLAARGQALIAADGFGLLIPLAGSGGRFGGYHVAEGSGRRLKPLLPIFRLGREAVSSLDIRAAHARFLSMHNKTTVPLLLSCSHLTDSIAREWATGNLDLEIELARVPEMYRIKVNPQDVAANSPVNGADDILRDLDGAPLLKPSGSIGMFMAAIHGGVLERWKRRGVQVVAAANADDVAFRVDPRIVGMFAASAELDAVILTVPLESCDTPSPRGGLLRERPADRGWSAYIEEHACPVNGSSEEQFNTNQVYFRVESLCGLADEALAQGGGLDAIRRRLPLYFEVKHVPVGNRQVGALHAYQTYADVLRLLPAVTPLSMTRNPRTGQPRGYAPLKSQSDVEAAQTVLDAIGAVGDELGFLFHGDPHE
jgi:hypothetical protein